MSSHHPSFKSSGFGLVFKSLTKSLKTPNVPVQINPTVVGGSTDQDKLLTHIRSGLLPLRASAAAKLTESLQNFLVSSIPEIWYLARDMCSHRVQLSIRRTAVHLLIECIKHDEKSVSNRLMYFKDIVTYCNKGDAEYDLFLRALRVLTDDGKDIHDFCIYDTNTSLTDFLLLALTHLDKQQHLSMTIRFVCNCFKFNFGLLDDAAAESLIQMLIAMCYTHHSLLPDLMDTLKVVVVFGTVPGSLYTDFVHVCLYVYGVSDGDVAKCVGDTIIAMSYDSFYPLLSTLCDVLTNPETAKSDTLAPVRLALTVTTTTSTATSKDAAALRAAIGAVQLVEVLNVHCAQENKTTFSSSFAVVMRAIKQALQYDVPLLTTTILRSSDRLLARDSNISHLFTQLYPFHVWYVSTGMFDVMKQFRLSSDQDVSYWQSICLSLQALYDARLLQCPKDRLVEFFLQNPTLILPANIEFVLAYYREERLCVMGPFARDTTLRLLKYFYFTSLEAHLRIETLSIVKEAFDIGTSLFESYDEVLCEVFAKSLHEQDASVIEYLGDLFVHVSTKGLVSLFQELMAIHSPLHQRPTQDRLRTLVGSYRSVTTTSVSGRSSEHEAPIDPQVALCYAQALTKVFVITHTNDSAKATIAYKRMISMCDYAISTGNTRVALVLMRGLVRVRATTEGYVYLVKPSDMEGLSTTFGRNTLAGVAEENPLWVYPETFSYLPEEYFDKPNRKLLVGKDDVDPAPWLELVLGVMENVYDWDLYSFVWAHFCSQLANMALFAGQADLIVRLKGIVCDQLTLNLPQRLVLPSLNTKGDLQVAYVRTLSGLMGYHDLFSKQDEDNIVSALVIGLDSWDKTAVPCIHILTVCCYEIPMSIKKYLPVILSKLQTRLANPKSGGHTLEFLLSLIHLPTMTSNFTMDEFKRVFAVAFKYIQYANDMQHQTPEKVVQPLPKQGIDTKVDLVALTQVETHPLINRYLLELSYCVILTWFLKIDLNDRKLVSGYIVKNLILSNSSQTELDEEIVAVLDLLIRFTYSNMPVKNVNPGNSVKIHEDSSSSKWILGYSVISIDTNKVSGDTVFTIRRPGGVTILNLALDRSMVPSGQNVITSNHLLLQIFNNLAPNGKVKPIPVIEDAATMRAISTFDRIAIVDFHKIGLVYIGPGQSQAAEVLSNQVGSRAYQEFLLKIGQFIRLKHRRDWYVGGLDTESDVDGEYGLFWNDEMTQVIFHTTTLMPNNPNDVQFDLKKRHIGNNYTNVFFDESGLPFNFNMIPSQFNFLNIVILPNSITHEPYREVNRSEKFYRIKVLRREGTPGLFSACHFKLISEHQLPNYIRNLALLCDYFANTWHGNSQGSFLSNWTHRVKQLSLLRDRTLMNHKILMEEQQHEDDARARDTTASLLQQLHGTAASAHETRYEYLRGDESELYSLVEFNLYT